MRKHSAGAVIDGDLVLTSPKPTCHAGTWVNGRIGSFTFEAKVFPEHAMCPGFEIGRSRISKLCLRRADTGAFAYNWDRGLDLAPVGDEAKNAVKRIAKHLANYCFGACTRQSTPATGTRDARRWVNPDFVGIPKVVHEAMTAYSEYTDDRSGNDDANTRAWQEARAKLVQWLKAKRKRKVVRKVVLVRSSGSNP
jgi:hypothetical protein